MTRYLGCLADDSLPSQVMQDVALKTVEAMSLLHTVRDFLRKADQLAYSQQQLVIRAIVESNRLLGEC